MDLNKLFSVNIRILLSNIKKVKNMENRTGQKWSREETILAFELYCRTPFSKITKTNKDIIELAKLLGRSPSSVGLKMANLAHPEAGCGQSPRKRDYRCRYLCCKKS